MAKKKPTREGEPAADGANIPGLAALAKEFKTNKMPAKKVHALKEKLRQLTDAETATKEEWELLETILRKQRSFNLQKKANIEDKDKFWLNAREAARLTEKCIVKSETVPAVLKLHHGLECKFEYDSDNDRFVVYAPEIIPSELQISRKTALKELKGHPVDPSEYPADKTLVHRLVLPPREFNVWFDVVEDVLGTEDEEGSEEVYTF
jgi:hypothetical protein